MTEDELELHRRKAFMRAMKDLDNDFRQQYEYLEFLAGRTQMRKDVVLSKDTTRKVDALYAKHLSAKEDE